MKINISSKTLLNTLVCISVMQMGYGQAIKTLPPQLTERNIPQVIAAMTLDEKARLVVGNDPGFPRGYPSIFGGPDTLFGKVPNIVGNTKQLVQGCAGTTYPIPRLGIPSIVLADGPAGLRIDPKRPDTDKTYYATAFPIASLLSSTWNPAIVNTAGRAIGNEVLEYGVDILLAPALNIHRNPLGGRNFEYYSEDPVLSGSMAAAMVNGVQSNGVGTSVKHFAANNNEANRMSINAVVSAQALREIYLRSFELALAKSKPWTVMSAYNKINGVFSSQSPALLTGILRDEWNYKGFVMTDWFAGRNQVQQIAAGNDMIMPGSAYIPAQIVEAVRSGKLDEKLLNRDVAAILNIIVKTPHFKKYKYSDSPDLKAHALVARQVAAEGFVLLKNAGNTLPLTQNISKIALFGNGSYRTLSGGTGSGDVNKAYNVNINEGLDAAGLKTDKGIKALYQAFFKHADDTLTKPASFMDRKPVIEELSLPDSIITANAGENDLAVITISRVSGEFHDRRLKDDYELTGIELKLIKQVSAAFHANGKKVVVLLNIGGVIGTTKWRNEVDAILLVWQPGQEGGHAIADVLLGKINPSGKLPVTFPELYSDVPSAGNFPNENENPEAVTYAEGIYVGYRYYQAFAVKPAFEFGFGLSYTTFTYSGLKITPGKLPGSATITVTVKNSGKAAGKEVVQLYTEKPAANGSKKFSALTAYYKTKMLLPGQAETVMFNISADNLEAFDEQKSAWMLHSGNYKLSVNSSSADIRQTGTLSVASAKVLRRVSRVLQPVANINELK